MSVRPPTRILIAEDDPDIASLLDHYLRKAGFTATVLRPWYVLGPGHRWPMVLLPLYKLAECFPPMRESAERLGSVTIQQMVNALVHGVENPPNRGRIRIIDVPAIRRGGR